VGNQGAQFRFTEAAERRHSGIYFSAPQNCHELGIRSFTNLWASGDIGAALGPSAIQSMAGCASGLEEFASIGALRLLCPGIEAEHD
jgi:hypothetical protein